MLLWSALAKRVSYAAIKSSSACITRLSYRWRQSCTTPEATAANSNATPRMDAAGSTAGASAALLEDLAAANITPWPHQLDAISKIVTTKTKRCLVQHAARPGKSLTIAGLASSLADDGFRVVVICDRRQLDAQIYATVRRVCQRRHSVGRAASVADLATSAETVLCTTLQKVSRASQSQRSTKTAVLVDECHRSYADETGVAAARRGARRASLIVRFRAQIRFDASARWRDGVDCTQVGFTATPEDRELATLGNPLHCFPLSAAIQHGFVLDVLRTSGRRDCPSLC